MKEGNLSTETTQPIVSSGDGPETAAPARVLILSAEMGEGHNAAAAAITAAITEVWPGCQVERYDTWELWGPRFSRAATWGYKVQMQILPLTYEVFYDWLCRSERFAGITKAAIGRFFGRRLERFLASRDYDLIISTYPFGSAALDWLRSHRAYLVPTVTYVPAFHVHPCWTYPGINQHYVMYDTATEHARTAGFDLTMRVGAPPVTDGFGTVSKAEARRLLELDDRAFIVLVTGGAWGLGGISEAVRALVTCGQDMQVLAVCGRSVKLMEHLQALAVPPERLRVLGYVRNMHELMAAADVVITNGAGVTVLEALCTPRPVIAFRPLAGHGRASTAEMIRRDLAVVAHDVPALVSVVRQLACDEALMTRMELAGQMWVNGRDLRGSVREMEQLFHTAAEQLAPAVARGRTRPQRRAARGSAIS